MHEQRLVCRERCWITFFHLFANNGCIELRDVNMDLRRSVEVGSKNVFVNLRQPLLQIDSMKLVQKLSNKVSCFRNRHARNTVLADEKFKSGGGRSKQWQPQQEPECALVKALNYSTERIGQTWVRLVYHLQRSAGRPFPFGVSFSGAFVVRMTQNFEWFEQLRLQHATLSGGILYNGLE
jgi:hypothetical protein